jgi:ribosomal protein S18 acetylase RimI-like enzyme
LELLPSYENLIHIPLSNKWRSKCIIASNSIPSAGRSIHGQDTTTAIVHYLASPLPLNILQQCIDIFTVNMSNMYQNSSWGLDIQQKMNELKHPDAKFLIVLSSSPITKANDDANVVECADTKPNRQHDDDNPATTIENDQTTNHECTTQVLGFVHFRYEYDNDDNDNLNANNNDPITYLYEIQIHSKVQKFGIGNKLLTILELVSQKLLMKKIILTVFKSNTAAMNFYIKRNYVIDESSPSNFITQSSSSLSLSSSDNNDEQCVDYEILSKQIHL